MLMGDDFVTHAGLHYVRSSLSLSLSLSHASLSSGGGRKEGMVMQGFSLLVQERNHFTLFVSLSL